MKQVTHCVFLLALCLILMMSCESCSTPTDSRAPLQHGTVVYTFPEVAFTDKVTESQKDSFIAGIQKWNDALPDGILWQEIDITHVASHKGKRVLGQCQSLIVVDVIDSSAPLIVIRDKAHGGINTLGLTVWHPCEITHVWIVRDRVVSRLDQVNIMAHEFGHALGLGHLKSKTSLMSEIYSAECRGCVTKMDAKELCYHIGCNVNDVRKCD